MSSVRVGQALALPPEGRGPALLEIAEDQWYERKGPRISVQSLANLEVGFGNADGGTIVVGISKEGVEGIDRYPKHRNELIQAAIDLTEPPVRARSHLVECANGRGRPDHLLVIEVEPGEIIHTNQRDEAFLRVGDENRKLTYRQRQELAYDKGQAVFEASSVSGSTLEDLDQSLLTSYATALGHPDPIRLLAARGLRDKQDRITAAGLLLFGHTPQSHFPEAHVRILKYRGVERGAGARQQLLDDVRCEGSIPVILDTAATAIRRLQPARRALGGAGRFESVGLIPEDAWLEGLVNGVIHRSYSLGGDHIRVEIFDDRIEIESPGRFPGLVNPDDPLSATRFARNPRIARVCADLDFGEELGEGIRRMFEEMRLAGLADPLYRQTAGSVRLTLLVAPVDRDLEARLPSRSRELLASLRQGGRLSTGDLADAVGLSRPATIRRLRALQLAGLIEWVGQSAKDPRAFWRVRNE